MTKTVRVTVSRMTMEPIKKVSDLIDPQGVYSQSEYRVKLEALDSFIKSIIDSPDFLNVSIKR